MTGNNTTDTYPCVRFYVSTASFSLLLFFNIIINSTILRVEHLRSHARFVLVFHLLLSALVYQGMNSVFQYQIYLGARPSPVACMAMIAVLISSASNTLLTLTCMALDRYLAVCHALLYASRCAGGAWPWLLGLFTWLAALVIPLGLLLSSDEETFGEGECKPDQLRQGQLQKVVFIGVCTVLILYSYVRILMEGRRLGVFNRRNQAGCRTIALHGSQLAVFILPNFVNFGLTVLYKKKLIEQETKELSAVVVFAFFSLAQCVAPVVYGLRKEELLEQLSLRFPCCSRYLKTILGWTVQVNWTHPHHKPRERSLTSHTVISTEVPQPPEEEEEEEEEGETRPMSVMSSSRDVESLRGDSDDV